jgi:hypothetical protein
MTTEQTITCPNCSRQVEAGFKFCDYCGTTLDSPKAAGDAPKKSKETLAERLRSRREKRKSELDLAHEAAAAKAESGRPGFPDADDTSAIPAVTPPPPRVTSRPMKAEELRDQGPAIAGRLRWREGESPPGPEDTGETAVLVPAPPPPEAGWRAVDDARPKRSTASWIGAFVLHVLIAFAAGAALLAIAAIAASLTSNGRTALLEVRGLPIFIAGGTAIVVYSLLRTGPRVEGDRRAVAIGVLVGFVVLVAAVTLTYRPSLMSSAQRRLDQTLGIFGPEVSEGIQRFNADVDQWNVEVSNYRTDLLAVTTIQKREPDDAKRDAAVREFSVSASGLEAGLDGINKRMLSHADAIEQAPLRDALRDLSAVFGDELAGIRLLTRGFVTNNQAMIKSGDTSFKVATARAVELLDERVEPILERADIDSSPLAQSVAELRG